MIYGRVEISSLCSEQTRQEEQLAQLQGENVSLQSELAQKTNMSKVEEYAENELGLKKLDKSQIEYVTDGFRLGGKGGKGRGRQCVR